MSRRTGSVAVVAVALSAAVLAGCGGGGTSDGAAGGTTSPSERPDGETEARGLELELSLDEPVRTGEPVVWRLRLANVGDEEVALTFPDGQTGEVVLEQDGDEVYRWSEGQMFTQAVREEVIGPDDAVEYELEEPSLEVAPGSYDLTAQVSARSAPPPVTRDLTVVG